MSLFAAPNELLWRRAILLGLGCLPMLLVHGLLTLLMVFPLAALLAGDLRQAVFLLWWLAGTGSLGMLVYSSATYTPAQRSLPAWQVGGLITGLVLAVPLLLGFVGAWWSVSSAALSAAAAIYILTRTRRAP